MGGILRDMNQTFWAGLKGQVVMGSDEFAENIYERYLSGRKIDEDPGLLNSVLSIVAPYEMYIVMYTS